MEVWKQKRKSRSVTPSINNGDRSRFGFQKPKPDSDTPVHSMNSNRFSEDAENEYLNSRSATPSAFVGRSRIARSPLKPQNFSNSRCAACEDSYQTPKRLKQQSVSSASSKQLCESGNVTSSDRKSNFCRSFSNSNHACFQDQGWRIQADISESNHSFSLRSDYSVNADDGNSTHEFCNQSAIAPKDDENLQISRIGSDPNISPDPSSLDRPLSKEELISSIEFDVKKSAPGRSSVVPVSNSFRAKTVVSTISSRSILTPKKLIRRLTTAPPAGSTLSPFSGALPLFESPPKTTPVTNESNNFVAAILFTNVQLNKLLLFAARAAFATILITALLAFLCAAAITVPDALHCHGVDDVQCGAGIWLWRSFDLLCLRGAAVAAAAIGRPPSDGISEDDGYPSGVLHPDYASIGAEYDYIVVGGSLSGCAVAAELSESSRVLLLEAGPADHVPSRFFPRRGDTDTDFSGEGAGIHHDSSAAAAAAAAKMYGRAWARGLGGALSPAAVAGAGGGAATADRADFPHGEDDVLLAWVSSVARGGGGGGAPGPSGTDSDAEWQMSESQPERSVNLKSRDAAAAGGGAGGGQTQDITGDGLIEAFMSAAENLRAAAGLPLEAVARPAVDPGPGPGRELLAPRLRAAGGTRRSNLTVATLAQVTRITFRPAVAGAADGREGPGAAGGAAGWVADGVEWVRWEAPCGLCLVACPLCRLAGMSTGNFNLQNIMDPAPAAGHDDRAGNRLGLPRRVSAARQTRARLGVVVSAGTVGSARLLLYSGLGPAAHLESVGAQPGQPGHGPGPVLVDLPGVGSSLRDDAVAPLVYTWRDSDDAESRMSSSTPRGGADVRRGRGYDAALHYRPAAAVPVPDGAVADPGQRLSVRLVHDAAAGENNVTSPPPPRRVVLLPTVRGPAGGEASGSVRLGGPGPLDAPAVAPPRLLAAAADLARMTDAVKIAVKIAAAAPLAGRLARLFDSALGACTSPAAAAATAESAKGAAVGVSASGGGRCRALDVRELVRPAGNRVGTCRAGPEGDETAVVGAGLRVRGVEGLRVADPAVLPWPPASARRAELAVARLAVESIRAEERSSSGAAVAA